MANLTGTASFSGSGTLSVSSSAPTLSGSGSFVVSGLLIEPLPSGLFHVAKYVGEPDVAQDIKRLRRTVYEVMRRMGTPVIVKHMLNDRDHKGGLVEKSPNFIDPYGQVRNRDPLSHGVGFVSAEKSQNEWIDPQGSIVKADVSPGAEFVRAPRYRGFGPGYLTYIIEPDAAEDFFKHTPEGAFIKVQQAQALTPWWPEINDNDLLIHVELDRQGFVLSTAERYQAKMTNPVSIRGSREVRGRHEYSGDFGSRYVVNQTFEMALLPDIHAYTDVETDR